MVKKHLKKEIKVEKLKLYNNLMLKNMLISGLKKCGTKPSRSFYFNVAYLKRISFITNLSFAYGHECKKKHPKHPTDNHFYYN